VQLVGYDKTANPPYWKIRNSWGADWGENGYIRLPFGKNACGLANEAWIIEATSSTTSAATAEPRRFAKGYIRPVFDTPPQIENRTKLAQATAPDAVDWVARGATTPVKDQAGCGDCWAYATAEGIESAVFMSQNQLVPLSEQQLTSCDTSDDGCGGGNAYYALQYVSKNGIDSQKDYPDISSQTGKTETCTWNGNIAAKVTSYRQAIPVCYSGPCNNQDEEALAAALATYGPLTISVNAQPWNNMEGWHTDHVMDYGDACSSAGDQMDHAVQLVGYDKTANPPYWKIRNSWGADWGENGYIRLPFGKNACGLANEVWIIEATSSTSFQEIIV